MTLIPFLSNHVDLKRAIPVFFIISFFIEIPKSYVQKSDISNRRQHSNPTYDMLNSVGKTRTKLTSKSCGT